MPTNSSSSSRAASDAALGSIVLRFQCSDRAGNTREADRFWAKIETEISQSMRFLAIKEHRELEIDEAYAAALEGALLACRCWDPARGPLQSHLQTKAHFEVLKARHRDSHFNGTVLSGRVLLQRLADRMGCEIEDLTPIIVRESAKNDSEHGKMRAALSFPIKQVLSLEIQDGEDEDYSPWQPVYSDDASSEVLRDALWEEAKSHLNPHQARCFEAVYRHHEGSTADAAREMGVGYKRVDNAITTARKRLRAAVERGELALAQ